MPEGSQFDGWEETMDTWGHLMLGTITTVSEMVALGLGLEKDTFTQRMQFGPHLLAPTGTTEMTMISRLLIPMPLTSSA